MSAPLPRRAPEVPELRDGTGTPVTTLWEFLLRTGFLYREKLAPLDVAASQSAWAALLRSHNDVSKSCLLARDGSICAHVSGVRAYRRTWMLQHLAALPDSSSPIGLGRTISVAMIRLLAQRTDAEWAKIWYRPTNRFPARLFGSFAARIADPTLSEEVLHDYLIGPTVAPPGPREILVEPARTRADLERIEALIAGQPAATGRADDLQADGLLLEGVSEAFAALGLERRRTILAARRHGALVGCALLELSSPGLNFSELTSTFRVHATDDAVKEALVSAACRHYRSLGRTRCIALAQPGDRALFEGLGFTFAKTYACWTWHRSLFPAFCEHVLAFQP
jgi:hypothetical protein